MSGFTGSWLRRSLLSSAAVGVAVCTTWSAAMATVVPGTPAAVAAAVAASTSITSADLAVKAEIFHGVGVTGGPTSGFFIPPNCFKLTDCVFGDKSSSKLVILYGDSHARMWLPALEPAMVSHGLKLVLIGHDGCPVPNINLTYSKYLGCNQIRINAIKTIVAAKPKMILVANRTVTTGYSATTWKNGLIKTLKTLKATKAVVIMIGDVQMFDTPPPTCVSAELTNVQACSVANPNPKQPGLESSEMGAAKVALVTYLNTDGWLCTKLRCSPIVGDIVTHFDDGHLSTDYAQYLSGAMTATLNKYLIHF